MSRYKTHPHGLRIGSANTFFVIDRADDREPHLDLPEGVEAFRDGYNAIVSFVGYSFDRIDSLTVNIETPAQQICWEKHVIEWEVEYRSPVSGELMMLPYSKTFFQPTRWALGWLEQNVGPRYEAWDTYTRGSRVDSALFFKRRKDALAFVREVAARLSGIRLRD